MGRGAGASLGGNAGGGGGGRGLAAASGWALGALTLGGLLLGRRSRPLWGPAVSSTLGGGSGGGAPAACNFSGELLGAYGGAGAAAWRPPPELWDAGRGARAPGLFLQGLVLRFGFNLVEARRSFEAALAADPGCSLCAWGLAASYGPTINEGIDESGRLAALEAARRAETLARGPGEAAMAGLALARFDTGGKESDTPGLVPAEAFAEHATALARRLPEDATLAAIEAEAWMGTSPWRYFQEGVPKSLDSLKPGARRALQALDRALALDAAHPLALHLLVHLLEQLPEGGGPRCRAAADALLDQGLDSHLVHMAGHYYLREGAYALAVEANRQAMALDAGMRERCLLPYVPGHNVASLMWGAMLAGQAELALRFATPAAELSVLAPTLQSVWPYPRVLVAVRFGFWSEARAEAARVGVRAHPFARVCAEYAEALAAAAECRADEATRRLATLRASAAEIPENGEGEYVRGSPFYSEAPALAELAALTVEARLDLLADPRSGAAGGSGGCVALSEAGAPSASMAAAAARMQRAVAIQDDMEYMEPERWYLPMRNCLAALHLAAGDPAQAAEVLQRELLEHPRSAAATAGLAQAAAAAGARGLATAPAPAPAEISRLLAAARAESAALARADPGPPPPLCPELFGQGLHPP